MSLQLVPGHNTRYHLISYDARGREREERDGYYSADVLAAAADIEPTDVFLFSHGWQGDVPAARDQYGRWIGAMLSCEEDRDRMTGRPGGFRPLLVGLHWPSKAWGDEELGPSSFVVETGTPEPAGTADDVEELVDRYAALLGDSPSIRESVRTIVAHTLADAAPIHLPDPVRLAYETIDWETSREGADGEGAPPGEDREPFDAEETYRACQLEDVVSFGGSSLGGLLAPLRMLTFWHMKRRARLFGETGAAALLDALRAAAPAARLHLMGHSFGCVVASAAVAGPPGTDQWRRPVASLALLQGAMSLWSFCSSIPARPARAGYFRRVVADGLVDGPILTTTSHHDRAVRVFYPIGAGVRGQLAFDDELPTYGGIGVWGIRGPGIAISDDLVPLGGKAYSLRRGAVLNLDATDVINVGTGVAGAHNDICHPEIAQAVWQAVCPPRRTCS